MCSDTISREAIFIWLKKGLQINCSMLGAGTVVGHSAGAVAHSRSVESSNAVPQPIAHPIVIVLLQTPNAPNLPNAASLLNQASMLIACSCSW